MQLKAICKLSTFLAVASVSVSFFYSVSFAEEVVVAFGENRPPFVTGTDQGGLEVDIVRESLKEGGHSLKAVQMPVARLKALENMERDGFDAVAGVRGLSSTTHRSNSYIFYRNYAVTKASSGIRIEAVGDLKGKRVVAWQNAWNDLGEGYRRLYGPHEPGMDRSNYYEHPDQRKQVEMFWKGRADVLIIDKSVFLWQNHQLSAVIDTSAEVTYHKIFPEETLFYVVFSKRQIREDFNRGLDAIKKNGLYRALMDRYLKK